MEISEIKEAIRNGNNEFNVTYVDGVKKKLRLFVSTEDELCYYGKGMRNKGYRLWLGNVLSIEAVKKRSKYDLFRQRAEKCESYLTKSGLWPSLRECMAKYKTLKDEEIEDIREDLWKNSEKYGVTHFNSEVFFNLLSKKSPFLSINLYKSEREEVRNKMWQAIAERKKYTHAWRKNYDNSIEISERDGNMCGWYSNEFKGCGNGYYHFLLDERHALYGERD